MGPQRRLAGHGDHPLALRDGRGGRRQRGSRHLGPEPLDPGQQGGRAGVLTIAPGSASRSARGASRLMPPPPWCRGRRISPASTMIVPASPPGTCPGSVAVITAWPPSRTSSARSCRRSASSSDITSSRSIRGSLLLRSASRARSANSSASRDDALLALRSVGAQAEPPQQQLEVIAVRPVRGEAAVQVRRRGAPRAPARAPPPWWPGSAGGTGARPRPGAPGAPPGRRRRAAGRPRPRAGRPSARSRARPARRPRPPAPRRCRRPLAHEPAARFVAPARASRPARVPARAGQTAATSWSRCARRPDGPPLTSSSRSGMKTLTARARIEAGRGLELGSVQAQVLGLARLESHLEPVLAVIARQVERDAGHARAAPDHLPLVGRPRGARGTAEVDRLEEVRLARPVRTADHGQPRRQRDLRAVVVAEVAHLDARYAHAARLHVQADRHDEVPEAGALVPGLDQARAGAG